jgi:putative hydrolase of the HAD superfamily
MDGTIDSALYWKHVEHQLGVRVSGNPLVDFYHPHWNPPVVEILKALRAKGKRVVCGSNTFAPHWEWLRQRGFLEVFDALYASHEMGISKPSRRFFTHIMEKEQVDVPRVFFVDDYEENIVAAKALGIDTYHYFFDEGLSSHFSTIFT